MLPKIDPAKELSQETIGSMATDHKQTIILELQVLMKKEQQERNTFKARAYGKVITQLKGLDRPISSVDDLNGIDGIGEKIRAKIQEILETGKLAAAERVKEDKQSHMLEVLTNIYGVGPVKAKALLAAHPVESLEEFRRVADANPGILHEKQKIGLKYYDDFLARIPRKEMTKHEEAVVGMVKKEFPSLRCDVVGSYRRGAKDSGDIDILIGYPPEMSDTDAKAAFMGIVERLRSTGYIKDVLALGPKKFMGVCKLPRHAKARRLDMLLTNHEEYPYALLYFTGSEKYNIQVRKQALSRGYTLNEHGMKPLKEGEPEAPKNLTTEEDIVTFLGLKYIPPVERS